MSDLGVLNVKADYAGPTNIVHTEHISIRAATSKEKLLV